MGRGRCGLVAGLESWLPTLRQKEAKDGAPPGPWLGGKNLDGWGSPQPSFVGELALVPPVPGPAPIPVTRVRGSAGLHRERTAPALVGPPLSAEAGALKDCAGHADRTSSR